MLFAFLPKVAAKRFFLFYFFFWRAAYDAGLGWVLTKQSKRRWIVKEVKRRGWLDEEKCPKIRNWIKSQLQGKMGKDYSFDVSISCYSSILSLNIHIQDLPIEYNTWLLFRQLVDVILLK